MPATAKRKPRKTPDSITAKQGSIPPGLTSTVTPGGIAANDPDVVDVGHEEIEVELPADLATSLKVFVGESYGTWGATVEIDSAIHGVGPWSNFCGAFPTRHEAVWAALRVVRQYLGEHSPENIDKFSGALRSWLMEWEEREGLDVAWEDRGVEIKPSPAPVEAIDGQEVREILILTCDPHPLNPRPTEAEVAEIKQSFVEEGQLEPIDVRIKSDGRFEILSGETRWRAAGELNWRMIRARVRECDDATAVKYLAIFNAKRKVLDPIRKAQMIAHLTTSREEGGAGMTLAEAGQVYGIESAGGASNLKRLLQLPTVWQQRVISGELPESFARLLLPYCHAKLLMEAIDKDYQQAMKSKHDYERRSWESRAELERTLDHFFEEHTRPIEAGDDCYFQNVGKGQDSWKYHGRHPLRFELTPEVEKTLAIEAFDISVIDSRSKKKGTMRRATNVKAYDKLQLPAIKAFVDGKAKKQASKAGARADKEAAVKKPLTKAQLAAKEKKQAEQLAAKVQAWRHKLLRHMLIDYLAAGGDSGFRIFLAVACHKPSAIDLSEMLNAPAKRRPGYGMKWQEVSEIESDTENELMTVKSIAKQCLAHESRDPKYPTLPFAFIDDCAAALGLNIVDYWEDIQTQQPKSPLIEEFFLLHSSAQLDALGDELDVYVAGTPKRDAKVRLLAGSLRTLKLPKSIAPLKPAKTAAAKKPTKRPVKKK